MIPGIYPPVTPKTNTKNIKRIDLIYFFYKSSESLSLGGNFNKEELCRIRQLGQKKAPIS